MCVLILEDRQEDISLADYLKKGVPNLADFFTLAIHFANALQTLHSHRILHKNITPSNVLLHTQTSQVRLTGFNLAVKFTRENLYADAKDFAEAALPYISPELTGRINSTIDYRSDLYSFGAVLYELLTGKPPFVSEDSMVVVHSHIARHPTAPVQLRLDTPATVAAIVLKLLAKSKEDRYQSINGVIFRSATCLCLIPVRHHYPVFYSGYKRYIRPV